MMAHRNHDEMCAVPTGYAAAFSGLAGLGGVERVGKPWAADISTQPCAFVAFDRDGRHKRRGTWRGGV